MKIDFFGWLTIILALHCGVAWYCDFQYETSRTWSIVANAMLWWSYIYYGYDVPDVLCAFRRGYRDYC